MFTAKGVYTALVTPFRNGEVDYEALRAIIEEQIDGGVTGLVPVGTTGECPTLNRKEHLDVIKFTIEVANKRCEIIAGTGANSTAEAIDLTCEAAKLGADATLQVTPYYNKPSQEGLYRHFATVAEKGGLPIVLYNVPGRTGTPIAIDTVCRLSKTSGVVAIKEAGGSVDRVSEIHKKCDLPILSGDDSLTLPMMAVGARGVISVATHIMPKEMSKMTALALQGNFVEAEKIHKKFYCLFRDLFIESNPIPVKAALALQGKIACEYRLPMCEMSAAHLEVLRKTMIECGVL